MMPPGYAGVCTWLPVFLPCECLCWWSAVAPIFQPAPTVSATSNTSLSVHWTSAETSTQLRGVARNYSVYMATISSGGVSSWQVRCI